MAKQRKSLCLFKNRFIIDLERMDDFTIFIMINNHKKFIKQYGS